MSLSALLARAHPLMETRCAVAGTAPYILFFSLSDGHTRAKIYRAAGSTFHQAWKDGVARCQREAGRHKLAVRWLRVDRVVEVEALTWGELAARLAVTKRNYFRVGLALDAELQYAFLEPELNANAMLYLGSSKTEAGLNQKNFTVSAQRRFGKDVPLNFDPEQPVFLFTHEGLFSSDDAALSALPLGDEPVWLPPAAKPAVRWRDASALNAGRRQIPRLQQNQVYALIESSSEFLARQVQDGGQFIYGHFPCFGRLIPTYNSLRHASSVYSMLEAWELTRSDTLMSAIRGALSYLTETLIRQYPQDSGPALAYNVDVNGEIKLGANAVSLLALVKYDELTGDTRYRSLMESLALGIAQMQNPETGSFVHVLNADDLSLKEAFRIVYYDGEAAFGLMRLYGITADPRWLAIVERAFDYFIRAEHWKHHDHWLSYCANELTLHRPKEEYFRFGVQNVAGYLDFILTRETTYPTLLELSLAFESMLRRIESRHPEMRHVLDGLDVDKFHRALEHRAHYLLNGFFWPELAMYFAKPSSIVGSFFIRHHSFRVRIDDIEHYLSGYVAYWKMLGKPLQPRTRHDEFPPLQKPFLANWSAATLANAVGGTWVRSPAQTWRATGVRLSSASAQPGSVMVVRAENKTSPVGLKLAALDRLPFKPQAVIIERAGSDDATAIFDGPVLEVNDIGKALLQLGAYSRQQYRGTVVGVTGSAGKTTTCAMLGHMLRPWGEVGASRLSANTSRGIAWNLASIPWNSRFMVVEMAIAAMARSSRMTRPHVAVVTNIAPAHLQYHHSTENIARLKSAIFDGMEAGDSAIVNLDTLHADLIIEAAAKRELRVIGYGEAQHATFRLLKYDHEKRVAVVSARGDRCELKAFSRHMANNSLACLAVAQELGLDLAHAMRQLEMFQPLRGRGARFSLDANGKRIRVLDGSYNANPLSMATALEEFDWATDEGAGILLLGDMLELGEQSAQLHRDLVPKIISATPRIVVLVGDCMKEVAASLRQQQLLVRWHESALAAWEDVKQTACHNEVLMIKGSNSTGLFDLVRRLEAQ